MMYVFEKQINRNLIGEGLFFNFISDNIMRDFGMGSFQSSNGVAEPGFYCFSEIISDIEDFDCKKGA